MQVLISKVRCYFVYRQVATSRNFAWVSSCDARIGVVSFLKEMRYHVEFPFLKSVSRASKYQCLYFNKVCKLEFVFSLQVPSLS